MRSFFDALLGRTRPEPPKIERLFAMSTAEVALESQLRLAPGDHAGITFRPVESAYFEQMSTDLQQLLQISAKDTGTEVKTLTDEYGYRWIVLADAQFEDLVATIHIISETLIEQQFGEQLLAAVFRFSTAEGRPVYWIYNYKRGMFYPFVPEGTGRKRDNAFELRLSSAMEKELPVETELERWYPIWDIPF
ncbi:MAG TPA: hypothetical protein VFI42_19375 [Thermomicrobiaceae bacterium]|nr:hypothetical protein [Thermomicrobiaceae bacterium]